jgi:hypothetical protein
MRSCLGICAMAQTPDVYLRLGAEFGLFRASAISEATNDISH